MRIRWIVLAIVLVAFAPKPVTAFCQGVVDAAMTVFNELAVHEEGGGTP
jgi:hypothetical protein